MERKKKKWLVCGLVLMLLAVIPTTALGGGTPNGTPFQALQAEIARLDQRIGNEGMPLGAIIMWSGTIDANGNPIINGTAGTSWHICDGTNGTPDLRDRFIVGAGNSYAIGAMGGANTVTLTQNQMPSHQHNLSGTTSTDGQHTHGYDDLHVPVGDSEELTDGSHDAADDHWIDLHRTTTMAGAHSHALSGGTDSVGGNAAHENRPPYFALAYIMKVQ